jgi:hypothetical protein
MIITLCRSVSRHLWITSYVRSFGTSLQSLRVPCIIRPASNVAAGGGMLNRVSCVLVVIASTVSGAQTVNTSCTLYPGAAYCTSTVSDGGAAAAAQARQQQYEAGQEYRLSPINGESGVSEE